MPKFDYRSLKPKEQQKIHNELVKIVRQSRKKDLDHFLSQLLTPSESVMIGRRVMIARKLLRGYAYQQIRDDLKVGFSTIRSVEQWLVNDIREYREIRHHYRKEGSHQAASKKRRPSTVPGTLEHTIQHDNRFILVRLLLGL